MPEAFTANIDRDRTLKREGRGFSLPIDPRSKRIDLLGLGYRRCGAGARAFADHQSRRKCLIGLALKGCAKSMIDLCVDRSEGVFR